ncbi:PatB family C-S lyase [Azonexus sp.]|uniref:MalY/PatB family protein n=1 Tax=Azonexus sp. TaxID=1872668 RepID=UPI00281B83C8|nr:PatB family C-S lyase [Azonexus sp.]MDR1995501.1 PatB family C-S lyase [Azonexus sp.]
MSIFDTPLDRRGTDSVKWGKYAGRDILPLWVADMDFAAPPAVLAALRRRVDAGVFGYGEPWPSLEAAVVEHLAGEYGWAIDADWIVWLPGLVSGLNIACRAVEGEVLTATPVYPSFLSAPRLAGRLLRQVDLVRRDGRWQWDMAALATAAGEGPRLFLLCHPHNPVGRCWQRDELQALANFAAERDLIVCSDEIHCGLILDEDKQHIPFASLSPDAAQRSITLLAPSKTFNIPGLGCALAVIPDAALRHRFRHAMEGIVPHVNVLGLTACEAAYRDGEAWRRELIAYLAGNRDRVATAVAACPKVSMSPVEATYLAWIDVRGLGLADPARHFEAHGLGLSDGADFGAPGWLRLNFGCPRTTLDEALRRFATACAA